MYKQGLLERVINFTEASGKVVSLSEGTQVEYLSEGAGTYVRLGEQVNKFDVPAFKFLKENALGNKHGYFGTDARKTKGALGGGKHTGTISTNKDIDFHNIGATRHEKVPSGETVRFIHNPSENTTSLHSKSRHPDHFGQPIMHIVTGHPESHGIVGDGVRIHESLNESGSDNHGYSPNTEVQHVTSVLQPSDNVSHYGTGVLHKDLGEKPFSTGKKVDFRYDKNKNTTSFYRTDLVSDKPHTVSGHPTQHANVHEVTIATRAVKK